MQGHKVMAAALVGIMMVGGVAGLSLVHHSGMTVTLTPASIALTTTVTGNTTNVNQTPLLIGSTYYNESNFASYKSVSSANDGSIVALGDINGFVDGDYVMFNVNVTNSGHTTVLLKNYSIEAYFVNSQGQGIAPPAGYPANYTLLNETLNSGEFGGDSLATDIGYLSNNAIPTGSTMPWNQDWFFDNSIHSQSFTQMVLSPGQTFHYTIFMGLGSNAAPNIPATFMSISINAVLDTPAMS